MLEFSFFCLIIVFCFVNVFDFVSLNLDGELVCFFCLFLRYSIIDYNYVLNIINIE